MAKAIEMFLDERADAAVRTLWRRLTESGLPSLETYGHTRHRPHVSLMVTSRWNPQTDAAVLTEIGRALSTHPPGGLSFQALGTFAGAGGVLFLAAAPTSSLLALHERVSEILQRHGVDPWPHYQPGTWIPHCTLGIELSPADLSAATERLCGFDPFQAHVVATGVTDTSNGAVTNVT